MNEPVCIFTELKTTDDAPPKATIGDLPSLLEEELRKGSSRRLGEFLDEQISGEQAQRRRLLHNEKAFHQATLWTHYLRKYVRRFQAALRTGGQYTALQYLQDCPLETEDEERILVSPALFSKKLARFLEAHKAQSVAQCILPVEVRIVPELADLRMANGPEFLLKDIPTLVCIYAWSLNPKAGPKAITQKAKAIMASESFEFRGLYEVPTRKQVRHLLNHLGVPFRTLLVEGFKKYWSQWGFTYPLDYGAINEYWAGDGLFLTKGGTPCPQLWFYDPSQPYGQQLFTASISFLIDVGSRYPLVVLVEKHAPMQTTGAKLLRMAAACPDDPKDDRLIHGSPLNLLSDLRPPFAGWAVRLVVQGLDTHHHPNTKASMSSQNGVAERFVAKFKQAFAEAFFEKFRRRHTDLSKKRPMSIAHWDEFVALVEGVFEGLRHQPHSELDGLSPQEYVARFLEANAPLQAKSMDQIVFETSKWEPGKVITKGRIRVKIKVVQPDDKLRTFHRYYLSDKIGPCLPNQPLRCLYDPLNPSGDILVMLGEEELGWARPADMKASAREQIVRRGSSQAPEARFEASVGNIIRLSETVAGHENALKAQQPQNGKQPEPKPKTYQIPDSLGELPNIDEEQDS